MTTAPPTVGRIVHFCPTEKSYRPLAALITRVLELGGCVDLAVWPGGAGLPYMVERVTFSAEPSMGCWSWPPRS